MATQLDPTIFGYQNFYSALLTADITSGSLTISLDTVPSPSAGILIIDPDSTTGREIVLYTSKGASTITCPSDGRGWGGSTAAAHLTGTTVIMAPVKEFFAGLADGTLSTDPSRTILIQDHVVSGGVVAQSAGLVGTFSNIVFYLSGQRYSGTSIANKTYTASKDTYVDITAASGGAVSVSYNEVANGASAPALAANSLRIAKVVTSGAAITSVSQTGVDSSNNTIYPQNVLGFGSWKSYTPTWTGAGGNPAIGNGTMSGRYTRVGKTVIVSVNISMGSTTTYGSGAYSWSLPFAAANNGVRYHGGAWALDTGTNYYSGVTKCEPGSAAAQCYNSAAAGNAWSSAIPFTFGDTDQLSFTLIYETA